MGDLPLLESAKEQLDAPLDVGDVPLFPHTDSDAPAQSKERHRAPRAEAASMAIDEDHHGGSECIVLKQPPAARGAMLAITHASGAKLASGKSSADAGRERATLRSMPRPPMPELPARGEIAALAKKPSGTAPRRIGRGQLVSRRLNWRPGDPFGGATGDARPPLRWERVIATTCVTAACGMACLWIITTIFA